MKLYGYFRSSTSYRVRIALNLKGINYETVPVNLLKGEQRTETFGELSPFHSLPVLKTEDQRLIQSLAIIDWLDRRYPDPPLYPASPTDRARCLEMAYAIATDIHGVNNLRTLDRLRSQFGATDDAVKDWYRHWIETAFAPLDRMLSDRARPGLPFGAPTMFEIVAIPQIYNAMRYQIDMARYPALAAVYRECLEWSAFQQAAPEVQPDAPYRPTH